MTTAIARAPEGTERYAAATERNLGFVTAAEQGALRDARVFVCGVGGMGGAALETLVRAGIGNLCLADPDTFEASNLNRQVLATTDTLGSPKVRVARDFVHAIQPSARVATWEGEWVHALDAILQVCPVVVNGMDDVRAAIRLYRMARRYGATVIDAYTSPLPSVIRVEPGDPRPEERLGFPSVGRDPDALSESEIRVCIAKELEYVAAHSSALSHIDQAVAAEVLAGTRPRPSFAPVVLQAGILMAEETLRVVLGRPGGADFRGWFLNTHDGRIERPRHTPLGWLRRRLARAALQALTPAVGSLS